MVIGFFYFFLTTRSVFQFGTTIDYVWLCDVYLLDCSSIFFVVQFVQLFPGDDLHPTHQALLRSTGCASQALAFKRFLVGRLVPKNWEICFHQMAIFNGFYHGKKEH